MADTQDMKKWLDENQKFLASYLEKLPKELLNGLGIDGLNNSKIQGSVVSETKENSLKNASEIEKFFDLIKDIASEMRVDELCFKILRNVSVLTNCDRSSLFLISGNGDEKYLVSRLFDVTRTSTFEESLATEETEIIVPLGKGIAGLVATTKTFVNIPEAYDDPRFNKEVDKKTGYKTRSILCMPILNSDGECIGVSQIINKSTGSPHAFNQHDIDAFARYLIFCGIGLKNAQLFEMSVNEYERNKILLNMTRHIFTEQTNLSNLVKNIMTDIKEISKCERCCVYLLEDFAHSFEKVHLKEKEEHKTKKKVVKDVENLFSTMYDICIKNNDELHILSPSDLVKFKASEVARNVVISEKSINILNLELNTEYGGKYFKDETGFRTKSILSMPIFNSKGTIIGVTQQMNKINKISFDERDEHIIEAFSIFTGLGIQNCTMFESVYKLMAKQKVAFETLSYHATAQPDETNRFVHVAIPKANRWKIYNYDLDDYSMDDGELAKTVVRMFLETDILKTFKLPYDVLCRWTLSVKKNYRSVIYHNWRHAFNVTQTLFAMIFTGGLEAYFDELEVFALLVASLCHDLDHRGTNNAFQIKTNSPLATLYSTSVMEHHHFDQCIMILNSEGNNVFGSLSSEKYRIALSYVEHAILSTDLVVYFRKRGEFKELVEMGIKEGLDPASKDLIRSMLMTACDLSATCKPWKIQFRTAKLVASEFFEQGDIERARLGHNPMDLMDRRKREDLPKMQCGFYDAICLPLYQLLAEFDDGLSPLYEGCKLNRAEWQKLADHNATVFEANEPEKPKKKRRRSIFYRQDGNSSDEDYVLTEKNISAM